MAKLSQHQRAVLERLANGDEIWTVTGRHASAFWHGRINDPTPGLATCHALWKAGYIVNKATKSNGGAEYVITDAGLAALEGGATHDE